MIVKFEKNKWMWWVNIIMYPGFSSKFYKLLNTFSFNVKNRKKKKKKK